MDDRENIKNVLERNHFKIMNYEYIICEQDYNYKELNITTEIDDDTINRVLDDINNISITNKKYLNNNQKSISITKNELLNSCYERIALHESGCYLGYIDYLIKDNNICVRFYSAIDGKCYEKLLCYLLHKYKLNIIINPVYTAFDLIEAIKKLKGSINNILYVRYYE